MKLTPFIGILFAAAVMVSSCGDDGGNEKGGGAPAEDAPTETPREDADAVSGSLYIGNTLTPAVGYQVWLLDYASGTIVKQAIEGSGGFSFSVDLLQEGGRYSWHVFDNRREEVAVFDWSDATGIQAVVEFFGGIGVDLGELVLPTNVRGLVEVSGGGYSVEIGGSLQIIDNIAEYGVNQIGSPVAAVAAAPRLQVEDAASLLYGFHLRANNPASYQEALDRTQRSFLTVTPVVELTQLYLTEGGSWTDGARVVDAATSLFDNSLPWSVYGGTLIKTPTNWQVDLFTTANARAISSLQLFAFDTNRGEHTIDVSLASKLMLPPLLTQLSTDGSTPVAIDYESDLTNGVTVPVCLGSSDLILGMSDPLFSGQNFAFTSAQFTLEYYDALGTKLTPLATDFTAPYNGAVTEAIGDLSRVWSVDLNTLTFTKAAPLSSEFFTIPLALFPSSANGSAVARIKGTYRYSDINHESRAGAFVWLAHCSRR